MNTKVLKYALLAGLAAQPMHDVMAAESSAPTPAIGTENEVSDSNPDVVRTRAAGDAVETTKHEADNTARNKRDRDDRTLLPTDQPNNQVDIDLAAAVRSAIVEDDSLSMAAHNLKLIAANGNVQLRGPVESAAEKQKVAELVSRVKGVTAVDNQLEVDSD